jgi:hypothetical protein
LHRGGGKKALARGNKAGIQLVWDVTIAQGFRNEAFGRQQRLDASSGELMCGYSFTAPGDI